MTNRERERERERQIALGLAFSLLSLSHMINEPMMSRSSRLPIRIDLFSLSLSPSPLVNLSSREFVLFEIDKKS